MKDAKNDLREVIVDPCTRMKHALNASYKGEELVSETFKILHKLEGYIAKFEDLRVSTLHREGLVPPREQQEAHLDALMTWASCLPETVVQSRVGRERKDILQAVLKPLEERRV